MEKLKNSGPSLAVFCFLISFLAKYSIAIDTINPKQSINGSQTIVSSGQKFELGFFTPGNANDQYLGIWYKHIPVQTVVWVANRNKPLRNSSGILTFRKDGMLVILNQEGDVIWSSSSSRTTKSPVAQLLDTGNFVLKDLADGKVENYVWQSFDYPSDTLLPGMKLGWNLKTGLNRYLTSWKSSDDPSFGNYSYGLNSGGLPQFVLSRGSTVLFRSGPWCGTQFSGAPAPIVNPIFTPLFVSNANEVYYAFEVTKNINSRFLLSHSGVVQHLSWNERLGWYQLFTVQEDRCDNYGLCGSYGYCNIDKSPNCDCLKGFIPRSPQDWKMLDWSRGCVRKDPNVCRGDRFLKITGLKLPDAMQFRVKVNMTIEDCEAECLKKCSCVAYAQLGSSGAGKGCVIWFGDLIDIKQVAEYGQDLNIRVSASEVESNAGTSKKQMSLVIVVSISLASVMIIVSSISWFLIWKKKRIGGNQTNNPISISVSKEQEDDIDLPLVELAIIEAATNFFSDANKIGRGGFGPVYKGELQSGQEIAVKRLAENSGQGLKEFKNEVILISKLQHRNLVRLLGCCIQQEERMLIYEYMPNGSLDSFIFDETRRHLLNWQKRFDIVVGIARGLLYLHRDSRLRIIHRDLKASNVLLDQEMNPKISDFGMARMFGADQTEANTTRVVGTYGYMPPEYAIDGHFSLKSDVFSFGVILLEIVSGKKNRGFFHTDHKLNLLGHAWKLWNEGRALELVDEVVQNEVPDSEGLRCIQVGLLCVQQRPEERPIMPSVLLMLDSDTVSLSQPGRPGFYAERSLSETDSSSLGKLISNEITVTFIEGR
ncbi:G-type lectin S-receptor-like serine/threonine-protein kinase At4g27290 [Pistacia vera]|uniref:G-type lectin S-receptor-like serine/threonine-protein kinase At4g27290 n=1 Tax=Pistacia vera TaxID=55513 RepID=UPI001262BE2A|nr:G-type lectin S-receptor-like serine/threonine-protein kinase At4g27290 [Pistacia vera]